MSLSALTNVERELLHKCLKAAIEGPFFPDWEFYTIFGMEREKARAILKTWPNVDENQEAVRLTINNSLNNLLGYPHNEEKNWEQMIGSTKKEVSHLFGKWRGDFPQGHFDGIL